MNTAPSIDVFTTLIQPLGERMRNDERFRDVRNIVYDVNQISYNEMPAIEYALQSPWTDEARGSGSYSLQTRQLSARVAISIWIYDAVSRQRMDEGLFFLGGHMLDFLRDQTEFDQVNGVGLGKAPLIWTVARPEIETGYVGVHSVVAEFVIYSGIGK